jgi:hypothetical protein
MDKLTTHVEFDIPDDKLGAAMRVLLSLRAENIAQRPNGTERVGKNERAGKMNGLSIRDVILRLFQEKDQLTKLEIMRAVKDAGFAPGGINTPLSNLVQGKVIRRMSRGIYAMPKALPAPSSKKAS